MSRQVILQGSAPTPRPVRWRRWTQAGQPLGRALLWMDVRAAAQAQRIFATGDPALRYCLAGANAEWMPPKMLWLKEHEPERYAATATLIEFTDWIAYRLTGRLTLNLDTVTQRWFYHTPSGGWPLDFFAAIGLPDLAAKFPADILPLGATVGGLSAEAAARWACVPAFPWQRAAATPLSGCSARA
jgi:ribulose kinase